MGKIKKACTILVTKGPKALVRKVVKKIKQPYQYHEWFLAQRVAAEDLEKQKKEQFSYMPKISILVPTYRTPEKLLHEMISSVQNQSYVNWELCIADGSMDGGALSEKLKTYQQEDNRIRIVTLQENAGISGNTNQALAIAEGEYIALLDHDDTLEPDALYHVVSKLQREVVSEIPEVLYTDEDKANFKMTFFSDPNLKPDFSLDLLRSHNYITHFFVAKRELVQQVGGFRSEFDGAQDYDLILRCIEKANQVVHVPRVLYHWRMSKGSTAQNPESKMYCYEAGRKAVEEHLVRTGCKGHVEHTNMWGMYHAIYDTDSNPLVSIIIPNKDHIADLDLCIKSIQDKSTYRNFEFVVVENNSTAPETFAYYEKIQRDYPQVHVYTWSDPNVVGFNYSSINNFGVAHAKGDYLLLLNNDVEMISEHAIGEMLGIAMQDGIGAVGAKLLYADDTVQHAGVVIGIGGYAGHAFHAFPSTYLGFMVRARINCNYSAVTAACLMTSKKAYEAVGGFSTELAVAGNDVDYCLKLGEAGYRVVFNAFSLWHHYESKSRGYEDTPEKKARFDREMQIFRSRWAKILAEGDPFYNPNFPIKNAPFVLVADKD